MDCAVCYKVADDQMESNPKPYVHCIQKPRLTEVFMSCLVITSLCDVNFVNKRLFSFYNTLRLPMSVFKKKCDFKIFRKCSDEMQQVLLESQN